MAFYIRSKNKIFNGVDVVLGVQWSEIKPDTTQLSVVVFTTRKDAQNVLSTLFDSTLAISNNLDYE